MSVVGLGVVVVLGVLLGVIVGFEVGVGVGFMVGEGINDILGICWDLGCTEGVDLVLKLKKLAGDCFGVAKTMNKKISRVDIRVAIIRIKRPI